MTAVALFDYDGFICKAFYASVARGNNSILDAEEILNDLYKCACEKARKYFKETPSTKKVVSGHTYKKDIYPTYKSNRKKNEFLGLFRDYIIDKDKDIIKVPQLEADDVLVMMNEYYAYQAIDTLTFSDDKDLRYYNPNYCKINVKEEPTCCDDWEESIYEQMIAGDREDGITGIPNVGMITARKILQQDGYSLESVIKAYKDEGLSIDECLKQLVLVTPISSEWVEGYEYGFTDSITMNNILGHFRFLNNKVKEIYNNEDSKKSNNIIND